LFSSRAARTTIAVALTVAIAALFAIQAREAKVRSDRMVGVLLDRGDSAVRVEEVLPDMPAERAGLHPDDEILAINGRPLDKLIDYDVVAQKFERGEPAAFVLRRGGDTMTLQVEPGVDFPLFQFTLDTLALFGYLGLALLALFQGPGDVRARLLFLFAAAVSLELALPYESIGNPALVLVALSSYYLLTGIEMALELHLASVIPRRYAWLERRPWIVPVYYVVGIGLGATCCLTYLVEEGLGKNLFPWTYFQTDTVLLEVGLPLWAVAVPLILALQVARAEEPQDRHQAGLVLAGVTPWAVFVLLLSAFTIQGRQVPDAFLAVETLTLLAYPLAVFIAIYRYQLFDIELVVRRGLLYTGVTSALVLFFYAALGAGSAFFSNLVAHGRSVWFISAVTLVLGLLFAPLRRALQALIDRRFFPERHALRERLVSLAGELPGLGKLPLMGDHLVGRLQQIFAVSSASLLLADPESRLLSPVATTLDERQDLGGFLVERDDPAVAALHQAGRPVAFRQLDELAGGAGGSHLVAGLPSLDAAVVAPLLVRSEVIGLLVLGPKESSERFPAEELELLNLLTHHVATVFQNAQLFESATYESLTGLLRREAILEALDKELDRARRYDRPLTVGMADLDHFKEVNDRYGHLAGDGLLKRVAQVLSAGLRSSDAVGRYGGEEFLLVLPETELAGARVVADKLRRLVEEVRTPMEDGEEAAVTISIGLASLDSAGVPADASGRDLIRMADQALYRAKEEGRNRIHPPLISQVG